MTDITETAGNLGHRAWLREWVESAPFRYTVLVIIFINAIILGLETSPGVMASVGDTLHLIDKIILWVFVVELVLRMYAHGLRFFLDPWGVFDFVIVTIALVPASEQFSVLRALRILRALRLISGVPRMRRVVEALLRAVPGIGSVAALLLLVFYVFSVIATKLFGEAFPQWFGTIGESMYSLFQIMTLESWSMGIVRPVMEQFPIAWAFFVPFIIVSSFTVLNLFIAIIVDSMQTLHADEEERTVEHLETVMDEDTRLVSNEIARLRAEIRELRSELGDRA
ncbi:MAG: ion transporter [Alphaproteobacteria bacterium]|nr:ion transporter [Alphaproteobacteria bacterium]